MLKCPQKALISGQTGSVSLLQSRKLFTLTLRTDKVQECKRNQTAAAQLLNLMPRFPLGVAAAAAAGSRETWRGMNVFAARWETGTENWNALEAKPEPDESETTEFIYATEYSVMLNI